MIINAAQPSQELYDRCNVVGITRRTLNSVDSRLIDHGTRVAYITFKLLKLQGKYSEKQIRDICFLAMVHDIGAYKTEEIDQMVQFETGDVWNHSIYGCLFMKYFSPLADLASVILFHHVQWKEFKKLEGIPADILEWSQIIHLADRTDLFFEESTHTFEMFVSWIEEAKGTRYDPKLVDLAVRLNLRESVAKAAVEDQEFLSVLYQGELTKEEYDAYLRMLVSVIDFRSYFTVTHTITTTSISRMLATFLKLSEEERSDIIYGAMVHDLGKIAVPMEILEFPGKLTLEDMKIMKTHVDLTEQILEDSFSPAVCNIALRHHEKLDGSGYPRGLTAKDLTIGERIVAVADIVSALCGTRSYKVPFDKDETLKIVQQMGKAGLLDGKVVQVVIDYFDTIMDEVFKRSAPALEIYNSIHEERQRLQQELSGLET